MGVLAGHPGLLDAVRALRWPARTRVGGALPGAHRARLRGATGEFSEYRAYRQGDDPRRLDWRLLARSDRAYVRLADDHALRPTWLVVDASASMAFPDVGAHGKWGTACAVAIGLAAVAHAAGDPVGLAIVGDVAGSEAAGGGAASGGAAGGGAAGGVVRTLPARARRGVVLELAGALDAATPVVSAGRAGCAGAARGVERAPAGARVVVVSDFLGDVPGDDARADGGTSGNTPGGTASDALRRAAAAHVARGGEVHAVHVIAREELDPPTGAALVVDPEDARVRRALDGGARAAYVAAFAAWRAELARAWRGAGAAYATARTDETPARVVRRVVQGEGTAGEGAGRA